MTLTQEAPERSAPLLRTFLMRLFAQADLDYSREDFAIFMIHLGGPKINERVLTRQSGASGINPQLSEGISAIMETCLGNFTPSLGTKPEMGTAQPGNFRGKCRFWSGRRYAMIVSG